jgi:hypothetical protein
MALKKTKKKGGSRGEGGCAEDANAKAFINSEALVCRASMWSLPFAG